MKTKLLSILVGVTVASMTAFAEFYNLQDARQAVRSYVSEASIVKSQGVTFYGLYLAKGDVLRADLKSFMLGTSDFEQKETLLDLMDLVTITKAPLAFELVEQ